MRCHRRLLNTSYKNHVTKDDHRKIQAAIGVYAELLTLVKKWKPRWVAQGLKVFWFIKEDSAGHKERKKKRQTEEEVRRQSSGVDRTDFAISSRAVEDRIRWKETVNSSVVSQ